MEKDHVRSLFNSIANRYDLLNHVLSGGIDLYWRRRAIEYLRDIHPKRILDVATGTADFAISALRLHPDAVVGVDIAEEMLRLGQSKLQSRRLASKITLQPGDAESLPFAAGEFDAAIIAFGARNFENLEKGLREMYRILRHGGKIVVLEFSRPRRFPVRQLYFMYFKNVLPFIGRHLSKHEEAYTYLPTTVMRFPEGEEFSHILRRAGFCHISVHRVTFGIASIYVGIK
jgi:demethylmenaquinone methyltransferase/2-methoxy-6-polyprenyl-1,4-benzoquinol methylase